MRSFAVLAALVLLVAAFATLAPASLIDARVASATGDRVRLAQASGTVWSGSGSLCDAAGRWCVPIGWRVDALALLQGALGVTLVPREGSNARGSIVARDGTFVLTGVHLEVPAAALESAWSTPPVPQFGGELVVDAPAFRADAARADGTLDVRWQRARATLAGVAIDLGAFDAHAQGGSDGVDVDLANRDGEVGVTGKFRITRQAYALDVMLTPARTLPAALAMIVRSLGTPAADGAVHVTWQGPR